MRHLSARTFSCVTSGAEKPEPPYAISDLIPNRDWDRPILAAVCPVWSFSGRRFVPPGRAGAAVVVSLWPAGSLPTRAARQHRPASQHWSSRRGGAGGRASCSVADSPGPWLTGPLPSSDWQAILIRPPPAGSSGSRPQAVGPSPGSGTSPQPDHQRKVRRGHRSAAGRPPLSVCAGMASRAAGTRPDRGRSTVHATPDDDAGTGVPPLQSAAGALLLARPGPTRSS